MTNSDFSPELFRVIDANLNRLKEGIRVVEDILRYKENNKPLALKLKSLRHRAKIEPIESLLLQRDSVEDVLKPSTKSEQQRTTLRDVLVANFKRAEESSRVLEEMFKLYDIQESENFKSIRYELYALEKEVILSL